MKLHAAFVALFFLGTAMAQDSAPISLLGEERRVPICRGNDGDVQGCVTPPHATYAPGPTYPKKASKHHQQGTIVLGLIVGSDGFPHDIKVARGLTPELNDAAMEAVKRWKFVPASRDGKPVATQIAVEVSFKVY